MFLNRALVEGQFRKSSAMICVNLLKISENGNVRVAFRQLLENLLKSSKNYRKSTENRQKGSVFMHYEEFV